jgi:hypothetical protein
MDDLGILILTHSSRLTDLHLCSLNYLTKRYEDRDRLNKLPPFEQLQPVSEQIDYTGSVSVYRVLSNNVSDQTSFKFIGNIKGKGSARPQHVTMLNPYDLIVGYEDHLELWRFQEPLNATERIKTSNYTVEKKYHHPFFPGLHTVNPISKDHVVVSCSAPDAILILNLHSGKVEQILRMPEEFYGRNYDLTMKMDLWKHYIGNDYQTTHINSAYPMEDGRKIVVSTLIQGAIGIFDLQDNSYKEIIRGFVGCHGARVTDDGRIYFADSVTGCLVFLDENGGISRRFGVDSRWLHDVVQLKDQIYAFTVADLNELRIYNIQTGDLLFRQKFLTCPDKKLHALCRRLPFYVGNSTQLLSYWMRS